MEPISNVSLEKYAELCAHMADTGGDESKEIAIAHAHGVSAEDWRLAKAGWTKKMSDPSDMGKTAIAFMPLYQAAQAGLRGGAEPGSLKDYARIHAQMSFRKDPSDPAKKIDFNIILQENGYTYQRWLEMETYWTPVVGAPGLPRFDLTKSQEFQRLVQEESNRILG